MSYTASGAIERIKLKGWGSTSGSLSDADILDLLNDSLRSYVVPFLKEVRDEWFTSGTENITPDANGIVPMPNSVASTIRTIWWNNNNLYVPLNRIEPENAAGYLGVNSSGNQPYGYMLKGYEIQLLPSNVGSITVRIDFMERPAEMVLEEDAGEIVSHASLALTLEDVPLAWQSATPDAVDVISNVSPFKPIAENVTVTSLVGSVLTLSGIDDALIDDGFWVADVGCSPFPNVPIEFHPLLQRDVIVELYTGLGDKRLAGAEKKLEKLEDSLRRTMAPRTQGSPRPIINRSGPGMNFMRRWG